MKAKVHPTWFPNAKVVCACGNTFTVGATKELIQIEICNHCHPFFTGEMKFVDTKGRVEKFQAKQKIGQAQAATLAEKKKKRLEREAQLRQPKSLKDMLMGIK